ncbi:MAG: 3-dehydroquinate synthase [Oscillospiraceae bacterium]|jgi:3-dehydroquinate synthase|nr:3-dehydroquinate synthase [Oscillospiraceae bacterium]
MSKITVNTSDTYDVIIQQNLLDNFIDYAENIIKNRKVFIITDDIVEKLYLEKITSKLTAIVFSFKNGEQSKNITTLCEIYTALAKAQITRSDVIIALGGGVVGDIAGYAAATWLRGIDYIQIPTTLLAQIDSSVGGKTAVDIPEGKNLVGAFKQPKIVLCDPLTLNTLPKNILADGVAEAIKYGMIKDKNLFDKLFEHNIDNILVNIEEIITRCIEIKRDIVVADEFEKGERMLLNFGHTLGHAVEKLSNFTIPHGSAVAIGMILITENFASHLTNQLKDCIIGYSLPISCDFPTEKLLEVCALDKKRSGEFLNFIVCEEIGSAQIRKTKISEFLQ